MKKRTIFLLLFSLLTNLCFTIMQGMECTPESMILGTPDQSPASSPLQSPRTPSRIKGRIRPADQLQLAAADADGFLIPVSVTTESPAKKQAIRLGAMKLSTPPNSSPVSSPSKSNTPFGVHTPMKYIDKTDTREILALFLLNFVNHEDSPQDNSILALITFLFDVRQDTLVRKIPADVDLANFFKLLAQVISEDLMHQFFQKIASIGKYNEMVDAAIVSGAQLKQEIEKAKQHLRGLRQAGRQFPEILKQARLLPENQGKDEATVKAALKAEQKIILDRAASRIVSLEDEQARQGALKRIEIKVEAIAWFVEMITLRLGVLGCVMTEQQTTWVKELAQCLYLLVEYPAYSEQCKILAAYSLAFFFEQWMEEQAPRIKLSFGDDQEVRKNVARYPLHSLISRFFAQQNNKLFIGCVEQTPWYYLLCFNTKMQKVDERIAHILGKRHKNVDEMKQNSLLHEFVEPLIQDYFSVMQDPDKQDHAGYCRKILHDVYGKIVEKESQIRFPGTKCLVNVNAKELVIIAKKIKRALSIQDNFLHDVVLFDDHHIRELDYHGGSFKGCHLVDSVSPGVFKAHGCSYVRTPRVLSTHPENGVQTVVWEVAKQSTHDCHEGHKLSSLFPACYNPSFLHYVEGLFSCSLDQNPWGDQARLYKLRSNVRDLSLCNDTKVTFSYLIEHTHAVGCCLPGCLAQPNVTAKIVFVYTKERIDQTAGWDDDNTLTRIITLFPQSTHCFGIDEAQNIYHGNKVMTDAQLSSLSINTYQMKGTTIVLDQKTKTPCYQTCSLSRQFILEKAQDFVGCQVFECNDITRIMMKITEGIFAEMPVRLLPPLTTHEQQSIMPLLIQAARVDAGSSHSAVGRAFEKHAQRKGTAFTGPITVDSVVNNREGLKYLAMILQKAPLDRFKLRIREDYGYVLEVRLFNGMGARWKLNGKWGLNTPGVNWYDDIKFIGFLEQY